MWGMAVRTAFIFNIMAVVLVLAQGATNACAFCLHDVVDIVSAAHCHEAHSHCESESGEQHQHEHTCKPGVEFNVAQRANADPGVDLSLSLIPVAPSPLLYVAATAQPSCDASPPNVLLRPFQQPLLLC
jgi:hypothetical protein